MKIQEIYTGILDKLKIIILRKHLTRTLATDWRLLSINAMNDGQWRTEITNTFPSVNSWSLTSISTQVTKTYSQLIHGHSGNWWTISSPAKRSAQVCKLQFNTSRSVDRHANYEQNFMKTPSTLLAKNIEWLTKVYLA